MDSSLSHLPHHEQDNPFYIVATFARIRDDLSIHENTLDLGSICKLVQSLISRSRLLSLNTAYLTYMLDIMSIINDISTEVIELCCRREKIEYKVLREARKTDRRNIVKSYSENIDRGKSKRNNLTRSSLSVATTQILMSSFKERQYPSASTKACLSNTTGLSLSQINSWFANARRRGIKNEVICKTYLELFGAAESSS